MLTPYLNTPELILQKAEREMHRAFHHRNYIHKADHFYNFCITAWSLREAVLQYLEISDKAEKDRRYVEWSKVRCLAAARDIANQAKHFSIAKGTKAKNVTKSESRVINVTFLDGEAHNIPEDVPDYTIAFFDGTDIDLYRFTREVIEYWKSYFKESGIAYNFQDQHTYFGTAEGEKIDSILPWPTE